jgi:hypothetical protein
MSGDLGITMDDFADGEVISFDPATGIRVTKYRIDDKSYALKTEYLFGKRLLDVNAEDRADAAGTGWGDGRIIGRIPLNILHDEQIGLMDAIRNYDQRFLTRFLDDNPALKTRDRI